MFNTYFDKVVCLSQHTRKDRWSSFEKEASRIGLNFEFFWAFEMDDPRDSFNYSYHAIIQQNLGCDSLLVLEDDARFQNTHLWEWVETRADCDILYLGVNAMPYDNHPTPSYVNWLFRQIYAGYTTHAVGYQQNMLEFISDHYHPEQKIVYDHWLSTKLLKYFEAHVVVPFISIQTPNRSGLLNMDVDYTDIFKSSEEYLMSIK